MRPDADGESRVMCAAEFRPPHVGEHIFVDTGDREYNGSRVHPGVVVRVWGPKCVNARVFTDSSETPWFTSLTHKSDVPAPSTYRQPRPVYWFRPGDRPIE